MSSGSGKEQRRCRCAAPSASPAHFCACFCASGEAQAGQPLNQPANLAPEWSGSEIHLSVPQISPQSAGLNGLLRVHPCVHARVRVSTGFKQDGGNTPRWEMHPTRFPAVPDIERGAGLRFRTQPPGCRCPLLSPQPLRQDPGQQPRGSGGEREREREHGLASAGHRHRQTVAMPWLCGLASYRGPATETLPPLPSLSPSPLRAHAWAAGRGRLHPRPTRDSGYAGGCRGARGRPGVQSPRRCHPRVGKALVSRAGRDGSQRGSRFSAQTVAFRGSIPRPRFGGDPNTHPPSPPPSAWPHPGHRRAPLGKGPAGTGIARRGWVFFVGWGAAHTCTRDSVRPMRKASSSRMKMSG